MSKVLEKPQEAVRCDHPHFAVAFGAAHLAMPNRALQNKDGSKGMELAGRTAGVDLGLRVFDVATGKPTIDVFVFKTSDFPIRIAKTLYSNRSYQDRVVLEVVQRSVEGIESSLGHFSFEIEKPGINHPIEIGIAFDQDRVVTLDVCDSYNQRKREHKYPTLPRDTSEELDEQVALFKNTKVFF